MSARNVSSAVEAFVKSGNANAPVKLVLCTSKSSSKAAPDSGVAKEAKKEAGTVPMSVGLSNNLSKYLRRHTPNKPA